MPAATPAEHFWESVLGRLQVQVTRPNFSTWLQGTVGLELSAEQLIVGVPNAFTAEWLQSRMHDLIASAVLAVGEISPQIIFQVTQGNIGSPVNQHSVVAIDSPPLRHEEIPPHSVNPRNTFDSFVVSSSNQLAHAASLAVADRPGGTFNPLFIYSGVGLGKTHLLQAITQRAIRSGKTTRYLSSEQFTNDFISAIRDKRTSEFRDYHRDVDILLIDDIQFISGKEQTQEGFFHTFNHLHNSNRQVVITCDRPPSEVPLLTERLRSRFEGGLVADIQRPDVETRSAILAQRCMEAGVRMQAPIIEHLALNSPHSIRQLLGNFTKVTAAADFLGQPITLALAESFVPPTADTSQGPAVLSIRPDGVIAAVAAYYRVPIPAMRDRSRDQRRAMARHVAAYMLKDLLQLSQTDIGLALGGRDPATIRYSLKKVSRLLTSSPPFFTSFSRIQQHVLESR